MRVNLRKMDSVLIPDDEDTSDWISKMKYGQVVSADFKKPRNYDFHKKYFALIKFAYENWQPSEATMPKWEGVVPTKSFDRFRKDLIILTGRSYAVWRVDGSFRIEADSISFARMTEEEFNKLYKDTVDKILEKILTNYSRQDIEDVIEKLISFY